MNFNLFPLLLAALCVTSAHGQTYRCSSGTGTYFSDRPCQAAAAAPASRLGSYGPARGAGSTPYATRSSQPPKAEKHAKYLPAECASISDAIRTGPSRGVRHDVVQSLQEEYRDKCSLEDQDARKLVRDDEARRRQAHEAQREQLNEQRRQSEIRGSHCLGMRDVVTVRRKREREGQMNAKEIQALRDLERAYNERCLAS